MRELKSDEIMAVSGGNPAVVAAVYVAVRYAARHIGYTVATGALGGAVAGYLQSES